MTEAQTGTHTLSVSAYVCARAGHICVAESDEPFFLMTFDIDGLTDIHAYVVVFDVSSTLTNSALSVFMFSFHSTSFFPNPLRP